LEGHEVIDPYVHEIIERAIREDLGPGDVTTEACVGPLQEGKATVSAQVDGVLSGMSIVWPLMEHVTTLVGQPCAVEEHKADGDDIKKGDALLTLTGNLHVMLIAERTLLNFLQHLSGVASLTRQYVSAVRDTDARIVDTRKTTPGLRLLEKAAVRHGGAENHRIGLFDGILIKDNHIEAEEDIAHAVKHARFQAHLLKIEVECETLKDIQDALQWNPHIILLDNMTPEMMKKAVKLVRDEIYSEAMPDEMKGHPALQEALNAMWNQDGMTESRVMLEASGNITLANVREVAETGVDFISVGAITHSAPILPMHMELVAN
jgi:nicotinate-nucleotide pyrophosphorylase (carboxylating)